MIWVLDGGGGVRIALSEPRVSVQDKTGIKEESGVPLQHPLTPHTPSGRGAG